MGPLTAARRGLAVNPSTNHSRAALSRDGYRVPLPSPVPGSPPQAPPQNGGRRVGLPLLVPPCQCSITPDNFAPAPSSSSVMFC